MRIMTEPRTARIRRSSAATTGITVMPIARSQISRWTICGLTRTRGRCRLQRNSEILLRGSEGSLGRCLFLTDGTRLEEKALHPVAIIAVNAESALAADGTYAKQCVDKFWNTPLRTGERRYYDNFLYMFAMLALSGNYRIY